MSDFLDGITNATRPEPNIKGNFDCMECYEPVDDAHYDSRTMVLRWWCSKDHESKMEKMEL